MSSALTTADLRLIAEYLRVASSECNSLAASVISSSHRENLTRYAVESSRLASKVDRIITGE